MKFFSARNRPRIVGAVTSRGCRLAKRCLSSHQTLAQYLGNRESVLFMVIEFRGWAGSLDMGPIQESKRASAKQKHDMPANSQSARSIPAAFIETSIKINQKSASAGCWGAAMPAPEFRQGSPRRTWRSQPFPFQHLPTQCNQNKSENQHPNRMTLFYIVIL